MSIIIKGMDMPEDCLKCPCFNGEFVVCNVAGIDLSVYHALHEDCPLVEIPTPHGRLIDFDALDEKINISSWQPLAPTILEAEE